MLRYIRSSALSEHFLDRAKTMKLAQAMVSTSFPQHANRVLRLAHKLGCPLKQNAYDIVAHQLAEAKEWHLIPPLVALGKRCTGRTTVRLLNWRIRATIELAYFDRLERVLGEFQLENLKPNQRTFHMLVSGHLRNHNLRLAKECLNSMVAAGFPIDANTHAMVVSVYRTLGAAKEIQDYAFQALRDLSERSSTITLNSLLQLYFDAHDMSGVFRVLSLFHHCDMDTTLAHEFGQSSIPDGGNGSVDHNSIVSEVNIPLSSAPIIPDATTFTILIGQMARRHDIPGVLRMAERMVGVGVLPDAATVAAILRTYFKSGEEGTAMRIIADMCHNHKIPLSLFNSLGLTSEGVVRLPFRVDEIPLSIEIFNALMRAALKSRGLKGARAVLSIMDICNIKPDARTISTLLFHLTKIKHTRFRDLVHVLRRLSSSAVRPALSHVHIIMKSVLRREKYLALGAGWNTTAAKFSSKRKDLSCYPEGQISGIANSFDPMAGIELPRQLSYSKLIRPIIRSLSTRHVMSDRATIALRIHHEAVTKSSLDTAKNVFREMLIRGMHPTKYHFVALMEGHAQSGDLRGAQNVMDSALEAGVPPNVVMFTILIVGYARRGSPDGAMRVFQGMIAAGIKPDVGAVDAIASAYFAVGAYRLARRVLLVLWPHVRAPREDLKEASLKILARTFRSQAFRIQHSKCSTNGHVEQHLTKAEQRVLHWKIARLVEAWKAIGHPFPRRRLHFKKSDRPRI